MPTLNLDEIRRLFDRLDSLEARINTLHHKTINVLADFEAAVTESDNPVAPPHTSATGPDSAVKSSVPLT